MLRNICWRYVEDISKIFWRYVKNMKTWEEWDGGSMQLPQKAPLARLRRRISIWWQITMSDLNKMTNHNERAQSGQKSQWAQSRQKLQRVQSWKKLEWAQSWQNSPFGKGRSDPERGKSTWASAGTPLSWEWESTPTLLNENNDQTVLLWTRMLITSMKIMMIIIPKLLITGCFFTLGLP